MIGNRQRADLRHLYRTAKTMFLASTVHRRRMTVQIVNHRVIRVAQGGSIEIKASYIMHGPGKYNRK